MTQLPDSELIEFIANSTEIFWAGSQPPLGRMVASETIYTAESDFRLPPDHHQRFDLVYVVERDLGSIKQWPLVVDEALRLLAPRGRLLLRFNESAFLAIFALANLLRSWPHGQISTVFQHRHEQNLILWCLRLDTQERRNVSLTSFSFGVIADARRPKEMIRFIDSVATLDGIEGIAHEVLVCGPPSVKEQLDSHRANVRFVEQDENFSQHGWITRKKNAITQAAAYENVLIVHDRYALPSDFLRSLRAFGGDFDVLVPRQITDDGRRAPDWTSLGADWRWTTPGMLAYGDYSPHLYVNGGLMLAKRETLLRCPWNELLFLSQAEDVELSRRLRENGIVPRLARTVGAIVTALRPNYLQGFETLPATPDAYVISGSDADPQRKAPAAALNQPIPLTAASAGHLAFQHGVVLGDGWTITSKGAKWRPAIETEAEIFLRLPSRLFGGAILRLGISPRNLAVVESASVNSVESYIEIETLEPAVLRVDIPEKSLAHNPLLRTTLRLGKAPLLLDWLSISDNRTNVSNNRTDMGVLVSTSLTFHAGSRDVTALGAGWAAPDPWGVWSMEPIASLTIGLPPGPVVLFARLLALLSSDMQERLVGVSADGIPVGSWTVGRNVEEYAMRLPRGLCQAQSTIEIQFHVAGVVTAAMAGFSGDNRALGVCLQSLHVSPLNAGGLLRSALCRVHSASKRLIHR